MQKGVLELFNLKDKIVIITGGAGFLGWQYAQALGSVGANVVIWDKINVQATKKLTDKLKKDFDCDSLAVQVDITSEIQVKKAVDEVFSRFKKIDVLINNAAMNPAVGSKEAEAQFVPYEKYPIGLWQKEMSVNLTGSMICIKCLVPIMMRQKEGVIINIASELSEIAYDHRIYDKGKFKSVAYITTKTGILGLTRAWAARLGEYNIRVNAFSPGGIQTAQHAKSFVKKYSHLNMLGRMAQINEYNGAMLFLCSDASSFMTGHNLVIDGGKSAW